MVTWEVFFLYIIHTKYKLDIIAQGGCKTRNVEWNGGMEYGMERQTAKSWQNPVDREEEVIFETQRDWVMPKVKSGGQLWSIERQRVLLE